MRGRIHFSKGLVPLLLSSLLIVLCLAGCAEDSSILDNGESRQLEFLVSTYGWKNSDKSSDQKIPSRATPISTFNTSNSFNVIADINKGSNWTTEVKNETVSYSTANNIWQTTDTHYWPGTNSTVNFYAYYPTSISSSITHNAGSAPILSYTVPDNTADQIDILASSKTGVAGNSYNQTSVDFKHIFAAVNFQVGSNGLPSGTISSITISGIKNSGDYNFGSGWTLNSGTTTFKASPSIVINGTSGESITSGTYTFLMIPQTFNNVTITLNYSNGTTFSSVISGIWTVGNTYTYQLSKSIVYDFDYTGSGQTFTAPYTGTYKIQCWGAQGGSIPGDRYSFPYPDGGLGGYTSGNIHINKGQILYIYVGQQGSLANEANCSFNGGGKGATNDGACASGGGETDIRIIGGPYNTPSSYKSRIIVAGGGGGCERTYLAGAAGGLVAYSSRIDQTMAVTQTNGYRLLGGEDADLGVNASGAGGGYTGGITGDAIGQGALYLASTGGTSFISGHIGCNAIDYETTTTGTRIEKSSSAVYDICVYTDQSVLSINDVSYLFSETKMIDGQGYSWTNIKGSLIGMPAPSGGTEIGHSGNGYARITFISAN